MALLENFRGLSLLEQDHFPPHRNPKFEGFYSRTQLETGESLILIFSWIKDAPQRPHLIHVSYHPLPGAPSSKTLRHEYFPSRLDINPSNIGPGSFTIRAEGVGDMIVSSDTIEYRITNEDVNLSLVLTGHTPWHPHSTPGPMGYIASLSNLLPLNWHVHSIASTATYHISRDGRELRGTGVAHVEKNWGVSFPRGWIWSQSFPSQRSEGRSLCLAGGMALPGVHAYLIGYRSPKLNWDFRPPYSMSIGPISPFLSVRHDSRGGVVELTVRTLRCKLFIKITAPTDSFFGISAPFKNGHQSGHAFESFQSKVWVEAWTRSWPWNEWTCVDKGFCGVAWDGSGCATLEFGGSFHHLVGQGEEVGRP